MTDEQRREIWDKMEWEGEEYALENWSFAEDDIKFQELVKTWKKAWQELRDYIGYE